MSFNFDLIYVRYNSLVILGNVTNKAITFFRYFLI